MIRLYDDPVSLDGVHWGGSKCFKIMEDVLTSTFGDITDALEIADDIVIVKSLKMTVTMMKHSVLS